MTKHEILTKQIENLANAIPELEGVLLASSDGLPIAHSLTDSGDPSRLAAMAVAAATLGARVCDSIHVGTLAEVSVRASEGDLFVYSLEGKAVLAVMGPKGANAGLIHLEARAAAKELAGIFA